VKSKLIFIGAIVCALLFIGFLSRSLQMRVWEEVNAKQPQLQLKSLEGGLGQGITIGLLGGFRSLIADGLWLQTNHKWEKSDLPATQTLIKMVTVVDPRPTYFWINGSRMIAYDMPMWRIEAFGRFEDVPLSIRDRIIREHSLLAVEYLERALLHHPQSSILHFEIATLYQRKLKDMQKALEYYRLAALQIDAPFYMGRLYGEMLRQSGQPEKAYKWLIALHPSLPRDDIWALSDLVLEKIRELEGQLNVNLEERYGP